MDYATDCDGVVAVFVGDHQRHFRDATYTHDRGIWLIDDWQAENCAELAGVGDGEGGAFDVFGLEFLGAGAFAEVGDAALEAEEIQVSGVLQDGDDQSPIEGDGDSYVDVAVVADVVAVDRGVDDGELL